MTGASPPGAALAFPYSAPAPRNDGRPPQGAAPMFPYSALSLELMEVQIFGFKKSAHTRKALRFFAERRIKTHFVDLTQRAAAPGELRRFVQKFGVDALIDRTSKHFLN